MVLGHLKSKITISVAKFLDAEVEVEQGEVHLVTQKQVDRRQIYQFLDTFVEQYEVAEFITSIELTAFLLLQGQRMQTRDFLVPDRQTKAWILFDQVMKTYYEYNLR